MSQSEVPSDEAKRVSSTGAYAKEDVWEKRRDLWSLDEGFRKNQGLESVRKRRRRRLGIMTV